MRPYSDFGEEPAMVISIYSWEEAGEVGLLLKHIKSALLDRYEAYRAPFGT